MRKENKYFKAYLIKEQKKSLKNIFWVLLHELKNERKDKRQGRQYAIKNRQN